MKQRVFLFPFYKWEIKAMNDLILGVFVNLGIYLDSDFSFFPDMFFSTVISAAAVMLITSAS